MSPRTKFQTRAFVALWILLKLGLCWAFDIHITEGDRLGEIIFNSSVMGEGRGEGEGHMTYTINPLRSSFLGQQFIEVDSFNGNVALVKKPKCALLSLHNPFTIIINARTRVPDLHRLTIDSPDSMENVEIPLRVHVFGHGCSRVNNNHPRASKHLNHHHRQPRSRNQVKISVSLGSNQGVCEDKDTLVLSVANYVPQPEKNCKSTYILSKESSDFKMNPLTGDLITKKLVCFKLDKTTLSGRYRSKCNRNIWMVPFKVVFSAQENLRNFLPFVISPVKKHPRKTMVSADHGKARTKRSANGPTFPQRLYVKNIPEEQAPGLVVGTFTVIDPDSHHVTYSLVATRDGRSQSMFSIDPNSGQVSTAQPLDRENIPVHNFSIVATNNNNFRETGQAALTIYVDDVNDHAPRFESSRYPQSVSESISIGATVLTVHASDEDAGANADLEYSILNPSGPNEVFRINPTSGSIYTHGLLDRETHKSYLLKVQATDKGGLPNRKTATADVEITILDENDNKPQFSQSAYTVKVSENRDYSEDPVIADITAFDNDEGANSLVRYSITGGNNQNMFAIDAATGALSLLAPLDHERASNYRLTIRAQDSGQPRRSNTTTVLVQVMDVNDNPPIFTTGHLQESLLENEEVGHVITRIQAFDYDDGLNSALIYSIIEAPEGLPFEIDRSTGVLSTSKPLDREKHPRFFFKIEAIDQGDPPKSATAQIQITVRDVNDNAPIFEPKLYSEIVSEEASPGTPVVTVTARDRDENENGRVSYAITAGNERNAFNIIRQMGQGLITVARVLNYKEQSRYVLSVTANDPGGLVDTALVYINVSDANTFRPYFQGTPYQIRVDEDTAVGSTVFKVLAFDNDVGENARITYTMDDNEAFQINPVSGEIIVKHPLDRESLPGYTVSVTATDNGRPSKSDTADVEVIIVDVNDNSPEFVETSYSGSSPEDAIVGTSILTISATDKDMGLNGRIRYTFEGGDNGGGDFKLDPTLGILRIAKPLDRERVDHYELRAFAVDRGIPERSTSVMINIQIDDINDNAPWFESSRINYEILENSPIGSTVASISAKDPDSGPNAEVEYNIAGGPDQDAFVLETRTNEPAILSTTTELDYESGKTQYSIVLRARSFHLFSDVTIIVHVVDVNDNAPQLKDFSVVFNNFKNHFPTGEIGRVPAWDPDVNDELRYEFVSGNTASVLHLDKETGMIRLDSRLNSDVPTNGTLQVSVSDGINKIRAVCRLSVRLVTEDMLYNSITLRLNDISQTAFLSPLYDHFVTALASIIPTTEDNIYLINVNDDLDVPETILNVSFSVRRAVEGNMDVFYSPQILREKVYHQRKLLAKLSTLEVLPFDDNLCVREPCLNFEECVSILKFGNASSFIGSDTMLFRPIHPINAFACVCPRGFTGMEAEYLCDTEVNLCYSSPCGGNGTCQRHEGGYTCHCADGYTGDHCQIDMKYQKTEHCPKNVCKSTSHCTSLVRGGFRCERCPDDSHDVDDNAKMTSSDGNMSHEKFCVDCKDIEHHTKFCELTTRSFLEGSFLMFPSLKRRHRFTITLEFSTRQKSGLLFYNGRYNERHDFIALEIIEGRLQFSFSLGVAITRVVASTPGGVNDGRWHSVTVTYFNRTATLSVGETCDAEVAVQYGRGNVNDTCASRAVHVLEDRCSDVTETCHRFLDLTGPFQVGGLPSLPTEFQVHNRDFVGCIRHVYIDDQFLDLNDFAVNSLTVAGCPQKRAFCLSEPCKNGGTCLENWHTYQCRCPPGWGGKDCSQAIEPPRRLKGSSYLLYTQGYPPVHHPWYNGISFRTRQKTGLLLHIDLGSPNFVNVELINGLVHYIHPQQSVVLDAVRVDDGKWHYLETRWLEQKLIVTLDYGEIQSTHKVGNWVAGKTINKILVGGQVQSVSGTKVVLNGFNGCIENVRVGNSPNSILADPVEHEIEPGCKVNNPCDVNPCPGHSYCFNEWNKYSCTCETGYVGANCTSICDRYNPCKNGGTCSPSLNSADGYICKCTPGYAGTYCHTSLNTPCPSTWWGKPICGPCNCPKDRGFDPSCNKTTGKCNCKENHFSPAKSDSCFPCDCYTIGSYQRSCDAVTGQCPCRSGVIGRRCDTCSSRFAEVTLRGCEVVYDACPRSFDMGLWWDRTLFGETAIQSCPDGTVGDAVRNCTREGWGAPNLLNCNSDKFVDLHKQLVQLESGELKVNTFVAKNVMSKLAMATNETQRLFGMDVRVTYGLVTRILQHEVKQAGLNLTHTQDRNFIQNLVNTVGRILALENRQLWAEIHQSEEGVSRLLVYMEKYGETLAHNMLQLFTQPFDTVHPNLVFGLDYIEKDNRSEVSIPKYNNKVQNTDMFDQESRVVIPMKALSQPSMKAPDCIEPCDMVVELVEKRKPRAVVSYVIYRTMGQALPLNLANTVRIEPGIPVDISSSVFTLSIVDGNKTLSGKVNHPISLQLKQLDLSNRTTPQCVYWKSTDQGKAGEWSSEGCLAKRRLVQGSYRTVCDCNHLSTYAIIMDISSVEYLRANIFHLHPVTYVAVALALLFLLLSFLLFAILRNLYSNTHSILMNLILSIMLANILFIVGIDKVEAKIGCTVVSILLHYFYMCTFSWMFVGTLHIYRMLTEIRNIDQGSMKFYYVLGYVLPGIICGLAVGLKTDAYGNRQFCWLRTSDMIIWSFAGPISIVVLASIIVMVMALHASCRAKQADPDMSMLRHGLRAAVVLLPLLGMVWVFAVLAVNDKVLPFQYLFAAFTLLQGVFIFLAYIVFNKRVRREMKYVLHGIQGKKLDETLGDTHTSVLSQRSALAYHNDSSLDGGLHRMNIGISTTSTTSRSTSKSSSGLYRGDGFMGHSLSTTSNSGHGPTGQHSYPPNAGIAPYGYDDSLFHDKPVDKYVEGGEVEKHPRPRRDSDSDSELSAVDQNDLDLASSHSSDDDEDEDNFQWDQMGKRKAAARVRGPKTGLQVKHSPHHAPLPVHSTPSTAPPPYSQLTKPHWPGEGNMSTTTASDTEVKAPDLIRVSVRRPPHHADRQLPPIPGSPKTSEHKGSRELMSPPERVDSLPSDRSSPRDRMAVPSPRDRIAGPSVRDRIAVQVLTHNGSITSESETTDSDSSSIDSDERWA